MNIISKTLLLLFLCVFLSEGHPAAFPQTSVSVMRVVSGVSVMQVVSGVLLVSLQQAATAGVLLFVCGVEQLDGLFVDQSPEVLKGDALTTLNPHLVQNLTQTLFSLHMLGKCRQLFGDHGLELGGVHCRSIICSFMKLCDHGVDGQLQI